MGGVTGAAVPTLSMPFIKPILTLFSTPEHFMPSLLGIAMVGSLSGDSVAKGQVLGLFGIMLGTIGEGTFNGQARYDFGIECMLNTPPLVGVVLGLFAIPELLEAAGSFALQRDRAFEQPLTRETKPLPRRHARASQDDPFRCAGRI